MKEMKGIKDSNLIPQHKRMAMGMPINNPPSVGGKKDTMQAEKCSTKQVTNK
jgi:hypothetical protein